MPVDSRLKREQNRVYKKSLRREKRKNIQEKILIDTPKESNININTVKRSLSENVRSGIVVKDEATSTFS